MSNHYGFFCGLVSDLSPGLVVCTSEDLVYKRTRLAPRSRAGHAPETHRLAISHVSRYYLDMLRFDWDEGKNKNNRIKHGVWFEEAQSVFSDLHGRLFYDPEHSEHEDRFILLGMSSAARTLVVVHCYRENDSLVRIISARKATRKEVRFYEEGI